MTAPEEKKTGTAEPAPVFSVIKGDPTDEEVAILAAMVEAARGDATLASTQETGPRDLWGEPESKHRGSLVTNPRAFRNARFY